MEPTQAAALLTDPMAVFAYLAAVLGLVFWLSGLPKLKKFFEITPPVIYAYFLPTISTTIGITPPESPVYAWMTRYLLPVALLLLMITVDLKSISRLGFMALAMMLAGTAGIVIGGPIAFLVFGGALPEDAWKGLAALSGSWIGGTANMVAIKESVGTPDSIFGPIIVVDTVVGYGWMGMLLFLSAYQSRWDRRIGARTEAIEAANRRLEEVAALRKPTEIRHALGLLGLGFGGAVVSVALGNALPAVGTPTIISHTTWAVLIVVTGGLALSFTPIRSLEEVGASRLGYAALYLLLTGIGAQADLAAVISAPQFLAAGVLWIAIHVAILLVVARLLRAPFFFVATGSMANVGGAASAPVVAGVYHPAMAPVGLLMAVAGYVLGIYGGLLCAAMLGALAG
ncbi:MAG: DUF819 family protein [Gemmatimonadetes bacterium]|nr:DUF819 family protein [Gemmatimonadota bacterium]